MSEASLKIPGSFEERKEVRRTSGVARSLRLPDHTANATGAFSVVVWHRPHDARLLWASKENEQ